MKRIICLLLTIIAMLSLVGCNDDLEKKIEELEYKIDDYDRITSNMIDDDKWLLGMIQDLQADKVLLNIKIAELEEEIAKNEQDISKSEEENDSLNAQLAESQTEIERLKAQLAESEKELNSVLDVLCDGDINPRSIKENEEESYNVSMLSQPRSEIVCGYRYIKILYDADNVKVRIYFTNGDIDGQMTAYYGDKQNCAEIVVEYYQNEDGKYVLSEQIIGIYDNVLTEENCIRDVYDFSDFKAYKDVVIPQTFFDKETGRISIGVRVKYFNEDEWEYIYKDGYVAFYYKKIDKYVILSKEQFNETEE